MYTSASRCLVLVAFLITGAKSVAVELNPIQTENRKPGADDWQLTRVRLDSHDGTRSPWIEGYCSKQSAAAGETVDIFVSTDPPVKFEIEIFRTGYYGGKGARSIKRIGPLQGIAQATPQPGEKNLHTSVAGKPRQN